MRTLRIWMLLALLPAFAWAKTPSIYVCAHPDDCFLFMSPNLYDDITKEEGKVVIVYLTSGDAGKPFSEEGNSYPFIRELSSIDATEWMVDVGDEPLNETPEKEVRELATVNDHTVTRVSYGNTVSYFLRLPDGNMDGGGFERYHNQSLRKLKSGEATNVLTIDGKATYAHWQDVLDTLSEIVTNESEDEKHVTLHISEPDTSHNIHDHSDHTTGASGVMEMLAQRTPNEPDRCYTIYKHIDYSIAEKPENLESMPLANKAGGMAVLTATQRRFFLAPNWDVGHLAYITRNYYSTEVFPLHCDQPH